MTVRRHRRLQQSYSYFETDVAYAIQTLHSVGGNRKLSKQSMNADKKTARNSVFDCHLSQVGRQMTIENFVYNDFRSVFVDRINVFDCRLLGVYTDTLI